MPVFSIIPGAAASREGGKLHRVGFTVDAARYCIAYQVVSLLGVLLALEIFASVFGLLCVWLTVRQNIWCWPTGLIQVLLFIVIFFEVKLYSDLILHVIYVGMQIYGWWFWLHGGRNHQEVEVTVQRLGVRLAWLATALVVTVFWGYGMATWTAAAVPYGDAFTTVASLCAQWMLARKQLESWFYWIAVDVVAIGIYLSKSLYVTTGLYTVFLVLATLGLISWRRSWMMKHETNRAVA
jgi:nicotinamide mononucleotide transporter